MEKLDQDHITGLNKQNHKLWAIICTDTDILGYSALRDKDEGKAFAHLCKGILIQRPVLKDQKPEVENKTKNLGKVKLDICAGLLRAHKYLS